MYSFPYSNCNINALHERAQISIQIYGSNFIIIWKFNCLPCYYTVTVNVTYDTLDGKMLPDSLTVLFSMIDLQQCAGYWGWKRSAATQQTGAVVHRERHTLFISTHVAYVLYPIYIWLYSMCVCVYTCVALCRGRKLGGEVNERASEHTGNIRGRVVKAILLQRSCKATTGQFDVATVKYSLCSSLITFVGRFQC